MAAGEPNDDDQPRGVVILAVVVFIALLIVGGVWLVNRMHDQAKLEDCMMAGRRNCAGSITR